MYTKDQIKQTYLLAPHLIQTFWDELRTDRFEGESVNEVSDAIYNFDLLKSIFDKQCEKYVDFMSATLIFISNTNTSTMTYIKAIIELVNDLYQESYNESTEAKLEMVKFLKEDSIYLKILNSLEFAKLVKSGDACASIISETKSSMRYALDLDKTKIFIHRNIIDMRINFVLVLISIIEGYDTNVFSLDDKKSFMSAIKTIVPWYDII